MDIISKFNGLIETMEHIAKKTQEDRRREMRKLQTEMTDLRNLVGKMKFTGRFYQQNDSC